VRQHPSCDPVYEGEAKFNAMRISTPGFGRLTMVEIAEVYKLSLPRLLQSLKAASIESDGRQKFMELAQAHNRQPSELYKLLLK